MTRSTTRDAELRERAAQVIPGGMYGHESTKWLPEEYPQFFSRASGARIWDVDDNEYIDFMCAFGPNLLGYNDATIEAAAERQRRLGDTLTGLRRPGQPRGLGDVLQEWQRRDLHGADGRARSCRPQQDHHGAWHLSRLAHLEHADKSRHHAGGSSQPDLL
jgi:hypothetical protein